MIPHAPPMRFPLFGGPAEWRLLLPEAHPLCVDGVYRTLALVELAAQAAGCAVTNVSAAHTGMLVEIESATCERAVVPAGEVLTVNVQDTRTMGALRRYTVHIHGVLRVALTLRLGDPSPPGPS